MNRRAVRTCVGVDRATGAICGHPVPRAKEPYCSKHREQSPGRREKKREIVRNWLAKPENREKHREHARLQSATPERRKKNRENTRKWLAIPKNREKARERTRKRRATPEGREKHRENTRKWLAIPKNREKARESVRKWQAIPENRANDREVTRKRRENPDVREKNREYSRKWRRTPAGRRARATHSNAADIVQCLQEANLDAQGRPLSIYSGRPVRIEGRSGRGKAVGEHIDPAIKGTAQDGAHNWVLAEWCENSSKHTRCLYEWHATEHARLGLRPLADILADMRRLGKRVPIPAATSGR